MATPTRRRPATRRQPVRRRRRTARQKRNDLIAVGSVLALFAAIGAARWVNEHRGIALAVGALVLLAGAYFVARVITGRIRAHRHRWTAPTSIHAYLTASPDEFEQQTAALCRRDGCTRVRVVGGSGDLAADVLATTPSGKRILIQCKRYAPHNKVGSDHVQRVNGTYRDIHGCQQAAIVTTSSYTIDAIKLARRVGMRLYNSNDLAHWAAGGRPPWN
ncbi:restriction endonuclease [Streptomyces sp. NBC_01476]|uniref:restriction endonuclease n=1 Tax=Streptomyces sp. NBC_01476 TaxID=2903881 RepID=UPI002E311E73|nr:restriction endonuclease [Streptomyces sp. NBC_01476]